MRLRYLILAIVTICLGLGFSVNHWFRPRPPDPRVLPASEVNLDVQYSNILPGDYVGPQTCRKCHPTQYSRWSRHPHRFMNQTPGEKSVMGDFSGVELTFATGEARFYTDGTSSRYFMDVTRRGKLHRKYAVTRTVGSRYMQFYIGRQLIGPDPKGDPIYGEHMLPFSYWFKMKSWYPRQYFDADGDEILKNGIPQLEALDRRPDVRPYADVCMNCHNTLPYAYRIYRPMFAGFRNATVAATIEPLSKALSPTIQVRPTAQDFARLNVRLDPEKDLITMGISCESCHFGGREHAVHEKKIRFLPTSKFLQVKSHDPQRKKFTPSRKNPLTVTGICVQCHSGRGKHFPNGAIKSNSSEANDFLKGFCTTEMSCVTCHDPHRASAKPSGGLAPRKHLEACVECHPQYADQREALAHSNHPAEAQVNCMDCHMPRYAQGLNTIVRTHRISHPVEESMMAAGSANACNLCHPDKSFNWTLTELKKGWGREIMAKSEWASFRHLNEPVGMYWLKGNDNHLRLLAAQCLAQSPKRQKYLPEIVKALNDPEPLNRVFHLCAVQALRGPPPHAPCSVDITAPPAVRQQQIQSLLEKLELRE